ncbi:phosphonate C-P lyase system protein PhnG [Halothiobacillus sp.]|uniref:phosphonate C-P lyase system protein PhnG n=1 Tax=Halothiobacillus sp. TaxID=1891311 RepID=UPI00263274EB|nr:phosphonate C-P lyase system protein PhnG [Halothiobacillus sp.]
MINSTTEPEQPAVAARQRWLSILARAQDTDLIACLEQAPPLPAFHWLRSPEVGLIMVQGRIGGSGSAFNLGEMTISRGSIRDVAGRIGHGYTTGRRLKSIEWIARLDAVLQDTTLAPAYLTTVIEPLAQIQQAQRQTLAGKAAATEVKFFTLETMRS